jgi:glycosyltransferase involved in cell wall biosynthesis
VTGTPSIRVMITADAVGGVWTYATSLARSLAAAACEVDIVTIGPRPAPLQRRSLEGLRGVSLTETDLLLEWADPAGHDADNAYRELAKVVERLRPDILHFNSYREAAFEWPVPVLVVAHSCVNSWAEACDARHAFAGSEWRAYSAAVEAGLNRSDAWVAPTRAFQSRVQDLYHPSAPGCVIWNGVTKGLPRRRGKRRFVLAAGRLWDTGKNLSALASIAPRLDWPVKVAGASESIEGGRVELLPGVSWLGALSHSALLCEMQDAAIFCSPALYEPFGLSVLEAASAGCALVLSDIPSFRELWSDAAMFFEPADDSALQRCLQTLCSDDVLRTKLQRAAQQRSLDYNLAQSANSYRALYASLTGIDRDKGNPRIAMGMPA